MGEENSRQLGRRADSALPSDWSKNGVPRLSRISVANAKRPSDTAKYRSIFMIPDSALYKTL
jgi:hypothetical protein